MTSSYGTMKTEGWSPKVVLPALVQLAAGAVLVVAGVVSEDGTLREMGYAALGAGLLTLGVGYQADPGIVIPRELPEDDGTGPDPS